jgi:hypothetical protein
VPSCLRGNRHCTLTRTPLKFRSARTWSDNTAPFDAACEQGKSGKPCPRFTMPSIRPNAVISAQTLAPPPCISCSARLETRGIEFRFFLFSSRFLAFKSGGGTLTYAGGCPPTSGRANEPLGTTFRDHFLHTDRPMHRLRFAASVEQRSVPGKGGCATVGPGAHTSAGKHFIGCGVTGMPVRVAVCAARRDRRDGLSGGDAAGRQRKRHNAGCR